MRWRGRSDGDDSMVIGDREGYDRWWVDMNGMGEIVGGAGRAWRLQWRGRLSCVMGRRLLGERKAARQRGRQFRVGRRSGVLCDAAGAERGVEKFWKRWVELWVEVLLRRGWGAFVEQGEQRRRTPLWERRRRGESWVGCFCRCLVQQAMEDKGLV
jgi:hypothetical protein